MKKVEPILYVLLSIAVIIVLMVTAFEVAMYADLSFYEKEYEKYEVLSDLNMEMEDTLYVTQEMMQYLRGNREVLSVVTMVDGQEQDFFGEQDRLHMEDVQRLFLGGLRMRRGAMCMVLFCVAVLVLQKKKWLSSFLRMFWKVVLGFFAVLAVLGIWIWKDFNHVFIKFHELFFTNDLWIFDPATDYMIRMLPEGLFYDMVLRIGGFFCLFFLGIAVLHKILTKFAEKGLTFHGIRSILAKYVAHGK
jgi:integral membrane protein (TIGR01906 family)